jgi:hypothetical protein
VSFAGTSNHFCFEDAFVEFEVDLLGQGAYVADVDAVFVE